MAALLLEVTLPYQISASPLPELPLVSVTLVQVPLPVAGTPPPETVDTVAEFVWSSPTVSIRVSPVVVAIGRLKDCVVRPAPPFATTCWTRLIADVTVTTGLVPIAVRLPPDPSRVLVVKVAVAALLGAVMVCPLVP
jgi:hypothetical protein